MAANGVWIMPAEGELKVVAGDAFMHSNGAGVLRHGTSEEAEGGPGWDDIAGRVLLQARRAGEVVSFRDVGEGG